MNKIQYLTLSGISLSLAGLVMLLSDNIGISAAKTLVPLLIIISGVLAIWFGKGNSQHKLGYLYHTAQGILLVLFGLIIAFGTNDLDGFLRLITYFMLFYGVFEFCYAFMALNSSEKLNTKILIYRFTSAFFSTIGAIAILATSATDQMSGFTIAGACILLSGLSVVGFSSKLPKLSKG